jgi:hypothetical protein
MNLDDALGILGFILIAAARADEPCGQYANGARYYLDWASHWFPVKESSLRAGHSHGTRRPDHGRTV